MGARLSNILQVKSYKTPNAFKPFKFQFNINTYARLSGNLNLSRKCVTWRRLSKHRPLSVQTQSVLYPSPVLPMATIHIPTPRYWKIKDTRSMQKELCASNKSMKSHITYSLIKRRILTRINACRNCSELIN